MPDSHPLDRPVWNALATRHAALAEGDALARRFRADISIFAAAANAGAAATAALRALVPADGAIGLVEADPPPPLPETRIALQASLDQMLLDAPLPPAKRAPIDWIALGDADAPQMRALAERTRPGPFSANTHRMGDFVGVRRDGRLVAMAGERLKLPGFTELSAVCTDPEWRGHGFAEALMRVLIERSLARGEAVFLHCFADNPAVRLYAALGFRVRRPIVYTMLEPEPEPTPIPASAA